jgi:hypothetical protein
VTPDTVVRSQLQTAIPRLLEEATVVVLTPGGDDMAWAVDASWAIARAIARKGRRVALVDLTVTDRALEPQQQEEETAASEGIVDAFCHGASLQRVVQKGDVPGLFFIGVGSEHADPPEIWSNQRWDRIARGFAEENALLVLFATTDAWPHLRPSPDRVITLGTLSDPRASAGSGRWSSHGIPMTHLIPDPPEPRIPHAPVAMWSSHIAKHRKSRSWLRRLVAIGLGIIIVAAVILLLTRSSERAATSSLAAPDTAPTLQPVAAPAPLPVAEGDSLYYSVQVASFKTRTRALEHASGYETRGWATTLTPVQLGLQGMWYRVMVGVFATPTAADSALRRFYELGLLERPNGTILRTPNVLEVARHTDRAAAANEAVGLREAEIPAYIVEALGTHHIVVGAFENPEQATLMDSILTSAGLRSTLTSRRGRGS